MKSFYSVIVAVILIPLPLAGCGNDGVSTQHSTEGTPEKADTQTTVTQAQASSESDEEKELKQRTGIPYEVVQSTRDTLPLLVIMTNLEKNMTALQAGIWRGDYQTIREAAKALANHAKIPKREIGKIREILEKKGLKNFVDADKDWHEKAKELVDVADEKNMKQVVNLTSGLLQRCANCHMKYREPLRDSARWKRR